MIPCVIADVNIASYRRHHVPGRESQLKCGAGENKTGSDALLAANLV